MSNSDIKVTFWGTQGTTAISSPKKTRYGANTPCVCVECGGRVFVFDMGTGFLPFGDYYLENYSRPGSVEVFISHYHLDHIEGLPFARLTYTPDVSMRFHGFSADGRDPGEILAGIFSPPYFPGLIFTEERPDRFTFNTVSSGEIVCFDGGVTVESILIPHPGGALSFKLTYNGKSFCYLSDFEYGGILSDELRAYLDGCELVVFDAYFSNDSLIPGWGHSTWEQGVELWREAGLKRMAMFHHNISSTDEDLDRLGEKLGAVSGALFIARDGLELRF